MKKQFALLPIFFGVPLLVYGASIAFAQQSVAPISAPVANTALDAAQVLAISI